MSKSKTKIVIYLEFFLKILILISSLILINKFKVTQEALSGLEGVTDPSDFFYYLPSYMENATDLIKVLSTYKDIILVLLIANIISLGYSIFNLKRDIKYNIFNILSIISYLFVAIMASPYVKVVDMFKEVMNFTSEDVDISEILYNMSDSLSQLEESLAKLSTQKYTLIVIFAIISIILLIISVVFLIIELKSINKGKDLIKSYSSDFNANESKFDFFDDTIKNLKLKYSNLNNSNKKKIKYGSIGALGLILVLLLIPNFSTSVSNGVEVDTRNLQFNFGVNGENGEGQAYVSLNGDTIEIVKNNTGYSDEEVKDNISISLVLDKDYELSNGDVITATATFENASDEYDINFSQDEVKESYEVSDLEEPSEGFFGF